MSEKPKFEGDSPPPQESDVEEKIKNIIDQLEEEIYVKAIIREEELRKIILKHNFKYEEIKKYISENIL